MDWMTAAALATLIVGLFAWLRADIAALRKEMRDEFSIVRGEIADLRRDVSRLQKEMAGLRERMARTEGLLDGLREAVAGRQVA